MNRRDLLLAGTAAGLTGCASGRGAWRERPLVIAHRGASGERPEHTLGAYKLAIEQGADFIECDLVSTRDGVLVCRHENEIGGTTDVASRREFAGRRTSKMIDGARVEGWFTEDFTLGELRTLRARERLPQLRPANAAFDGREPIPTFDEMLAMAVREGFNRGRTVGVYVELKHPTYFAGIDLALEQPAVEGLRRAEYEGREAAAFLQCFEVGPLRTLRGLTTTRLVQLVGYAGGPFDLQASGRRYFDMATPAGLAEIAAYADGIGPEKALVLPRDENNRSLGPTRVVRDAHDAGLLVHPWTFRSENYFLPAELRRGDPSAPDFLRSKGDYAAEHLQALAMGVDGLFTDQPADAAAAASAFAR